MKESAQRYTTPLVTDNTTKELKRERKIPPAQGKENPLQCNGLTTAPSSFAEASADRQIYEVRSEKGELEGRREKGEGRREKGELEGRREKGKGKREKGKGKREK